MNMFMMAGAAYNDHQWDEGVRSRPVDDFGGFSSRSWSHDIKVSQRHGLAASAFSTSRIAHWEHACKGWRGSRGLSCLALVEYLDDEDFDEPLIGPLAPTVAGATQAGPA